MDSQVLELGRLLLEFLIIPVIVQNQKQTIRLAVLEERLGNLQRLTSSLLNRRRRTDPPPTPEESSDR